MIPVIFAWLSDLWSTLSENFHPFFDTLDILIVATAIYWLLLLIRGTRAAQMTLGLLFIVLVWLLSEQLELATANFILDKFLSWGVLIVIVIFQADIRRALTRVGRGLFQAPREQGPQMIQEIVRACEALSQRRVGALIVLERETSLDDHMELGTHIDAELSRELLISLFLPYSPLHDGAVVVREARISAAGCILPVALRPGIPSTFGTRHRAAFGIADESDAIAIVVSEETGRISVVSGGAIQQDLDGAQLRQTLLSLTGNLPQGRSQEQDEPTPERAPVAQESS
jgi:uncharacterized protein (TIGR00159 family)